MVRPSSFFEQVLSAYSTAHGLRYVALRYFNAAGAHASGLAGEIHSPDTHLIPLLIKAPLRTGPALTIFGRNHDTPGGTCVRDYIHVSDIGLAHVLALEYLVSGGGSTSVYLGTGEGPSVKELMAAWAALAESMFRMSSRLLVQAIPRLSTPIPAEPRKCSAGPPSATSTRFSPQRGTGNRNWRLQSINGEKEIT